jgi:molecular chaperone GrpE
MKQKSKEKTREQRRSEPKKDEVEELRAQMDDLVKEKDDLLAKLQRVSADYANFQKRAPKQITDTISYEKEKIIKTLLPALDNFEHTLQNARSAEDVDVLVKGIQIIYDQMLDILKSHGIEQIEALGEKFDPALHEAMTQRAEPDRDENIVLEEFQKGYKLNGRVIRPSKVIVNKVASEEPVQEQEQIEQEPQKERAEPQEQTPDEYETTDTE